MENYCDKCVNSIIAVKNNHINCMKKNIELEKKTDIGWTNYIEKLPNLVAKNGNLEMIEYLWVEGYLFQKSVFMHAFNNYNTEILKYLIENNVPGKDRFFRKYSLINYEYNSIERVLNKLFNQDIKYLILHKLFKLDGCYIFQK